MKKPLIKPTNAAICGKMLSARQMKRKSGLMLIRITKLRIKKMLLRTSKGNKLNFMYIKSIRFMFLHKCMIALTTH